MPREVLKSWLTEDEMSLLGTILPSHHTLIETEGKKDVLINEHSFRTFVRLYKRLIQKICTVQGVTIVMSIDDMQWC